MNSKGKRIRKVRRPETPEASPAGGSEAGKISHLVLMDIKLQAIAGELSAEKRRGLADSLERNVKMLRDAADFMDGLDLLKNARN